MTLIHRLAHIGYWLADRFKRIDRAHILLLLAFCLPLGGRWRFEIPHAFLYGPLGDYLVPEWYLSDFLVLAFILYSLPQLVARRIFADQNVRVFVLALLVFLLGSLMATTHALLPDIAWYRFGRIVFWGAFALSLATFGATQKQWISIAVAAILGAVLQCLLSWYQYLRFDSLTAGWLAHLIGEQPLAPFTQGVTFIRVFGEKILRPYGTFPHPNVLAGYLLMSLLVLLWLWRVIPKRQHIYLASAGSLILGIIVITLSRTVWFVLLIWFILLLLMRGRELLRHFEPYVRRHRGRALAAFVLTAVLATGVLTIGLLRIKTLWGDNQISVTGRMLLNRYALQMAADQPWGVGPAHFSVFLRHYDLTGWFDLVIQPVHQVYLLVLSEWGWLSLLAFIVMQGVTFCALFLGMSRRPGQFAGYLLLAAQLALLVTFFVDHYYWTLQQGQLLLWAVWGLSLAYGFGARFNHTNGGNPDEKKCLARAQTGDRGL